jgi:hypothetical protein
MGLVRDLDIELHLRGCCHAGYETRLKELALASGLPDGRLHLHPPDCADEMTRRAAEYDIGLAIEPVASENNDIALSNKIFTYLLAGCAVVATRTRSQARLLPELGPAAVACEPDDPRSMADALSGWVRDRQSLERARAAAWQVAETRFNWDRQKSTFLAVVDEALNGS